MNLSKVNIKYHTGAPIRETFQHLDYAAGTGKSRLWKLAYKVLDPLLTDASIPICVLIDMAFLRKSYIMLIESQYDVNRKSIQG